MKRVRIGTGAAFSGDIIDPAVEIAEKGDAGYIAGDHLAELTLAIQQKQRKRDPSRGFAPDIPRFAKAVLPTCAAKGIKWIDNGGGANPEGAGERVVEIARELGIKNLKVAVIVGDDILSRLDGLRAKNVSFQNLDTGEDFALIKDRVVAANIYTGAWSIVDALRQGADVVITGRCA
ncbi:MAG: DUF1446 domain-containing protein, partial [Chloroflexi bacterium CG07_land_8_20_14_0_80_51_10]